MNNRINVKKTAVSLAVLLLLAFNTALQADQGTTLDLLRQKYERLYNDYTTKIGQVTQETSVKLAQEVADAKRIYEDARRKISVPASKTIEIIDKGADQALAALGITATSSGIVPVTSAGAQVSLSKFTQPGTIKGDNYCGQFAMATILHGLGLGASAQDVYNETNPRGIFTAPPTIVEYLNMQGVPAREKHPASLGDLCARLDAGQPAMVLVNADGTPHWLAVIGYRADASGKITQIEIRDSVWGDGKNSYIMDAAHFQEIWATPLGTGLKGQMVGYHNLMIDIPPVQTPVKRMPWYSGNFWTASEDLLAGACNDVVTGWSTMSPTSVIGGVAKGILGIPGAALSLTGRGLQIGGEKLADWGSTAWKQNGVLNKVSGGLAFLGGKVGEGIGAVARVGGDVLSSGAMLIGSGIKQLGWVFAKH
ncbi:MAG: hypothetical protein HQM09_09620 [Candidatus Riflebacteria bacterium]|nr:hypothetical protein [Candidatus Riflebacteria bacterium]